MTDHVRNQRALGPFAQFAARRFNCGKAQQLAQKQWTASRLAYDVAGLFVRDVSGIFFLKLDKVSAFPCRQSGYFDSYQGTNAGQPFSETLQNAQGRTALDI